MDIPTMINKIKQHPDFNKAGMVLCHNGVVRDSSREGEPVEALEVTVDHEVLNDILEAQKKRDGIIDILIHINEDQKLVVGDDVMFIVVAGNIRENVIASLTDTLNAVKSKATSKKQYFTE